MIPEERPQRAANIAKAKLKQYIPLSREVSQLAVKLEELESTMYCPKVPSSEGTPRSSGAGDPTGKIVEQKTAILDKYNQKKESLTAMLLEIEESMEALTPTERMLVRYKYMDGMTWEEVCVTMRYSWTHIHRIHSAALIKLGEAEAKAQG